MRIALAGNPNSGKTTMYNALTGSSEKVGNWAGVTVERKEHSIKKIYCGGKDSFCAISFYRASYFFCDCDSQTNLITSAFKRIGYERGSN